MMIRRIALMLALISIMTLVASAPAGAECISTACMEDAGSTDLQ